MSDQEKYPAEVLGDDDDNGTMPENVEALRKAVIGRRIVGAEKQVVKDEWGYGSEGLVITLDDGKQVQMVDQSDCCAYTELEEFLLHPDRVEHAITGVGTTDGFDTWHIYADMGDVLELKVGWSPGNPFYYGYGFDIRVRDVEQAS